MPLFKKKINLLRLFIGLMALVAGVLVYMVDRAPQYTCFISSAPFELSLYGKVPNLFGAAGGSLPDFVHTFGFIMITGGITASRTGGCLVITPTWMCTDLLFEFGQRFSSTAAGLIPQWFQSVPLLKITPIYFRCGTFDWLDIAAIVAGSVTAFYLLNVTMKSNKTRQHSRHDPN